MNATRRITVLVADESALLRALVRFTVTSQGWAVVEAGTADAARELARAMRPDLVMLDIALGDAGRDGLALCADLRADPATAGIPIVALGAHDDPALRERASAAQVDAFITSPFGPLDLIQVLSGLLSASPDPPALGVYLLDAGVVEATALEHALEEQRRLIDQGTPKRLGEVLLEQGVVSGPALDRALLEQAHARAQLAESARTRILVIDDHVAVREGLKSLIHEDEDLEVVGEAADAEEGFRLARRHRPDIIVLDNEMPGRSGIDLIPELRAEVPFARIVMFSLDAAARQRAIAAGAHAFVVKDAPMDEILHALRPSRPAPLPPEPASQLMPSIAGHRLRDAAAVMTAAFAGYAGVFLVLESAFGAAAGVFGVLPVAIAAGLLGSGAGAVAGVLTVALTALLWTVTGHRMGEPILEVGATGFGIVLLPLLGFGVGAMRDLRLRLDPRGARVDALAEAARSLAGVDPGEFVGVFLESTLRVVPADLALLYGNAAGGARLIGSSRVLESGAAERLAIVARDAMRSATARVIEHVPEADRPLARVRSAIVVPVSIAGQDVRGALILASARRFVEADIARVRPFAEYLWIVLRNAPAATARAAGRVRERTS